MANDLNIDELRADASRGLAPSQTILGIVLLEGLEGNAPDYQEAFHWLSVAAQRGVPRALYHLGTMYARGLGTEVDLEKAKALFERSADRGEFFPCVALARLHRDAGRMDVAMEWYRAAARFQDRVVPCEELEEALAFAEREG